MLVQMITLTQKPKSTLEVQLMVAEGHGMWRQNKLHAFLNYRVMINVYHFQQGGLTSQYKLFM